MSFKIAARTILHLGGELISSDAIALYELIKNAFDAASKTGVVIELVVRLKHWPGELKEQAETISTANNESILSFREALLADSDHAAPEADKWLAQVREARSLKKLKELALSANSITVRDSGHGMSKADLDQVYLTIGTRYRREERQSQIQADPRQLERHPVLGEKGLGRLSAMRLGQQLHVETTRTGEAHWNILDIDWSRFSHDSDELLDSISISPVTGPRKQESKTQGTKITISALNSKWEKQDLVNFSKEQVCKFINPFVPEKAFPISLRFNGEAITIPEFDKFLLNNAQGYVSAEFRTNAETGPMEATLVTHVEYRLRKKVKNFSLDTVQCLSASEAETPKVLRLLGGFKMEAYWFNRQYLRSYVDGGIPIAKAVNEWSGGLMLFRDGFRVFPYGEKDDDWLLLDRKALASQGYKVNRKQLIGKVEISSAKNPRLVDQTNREGLRDTPEKHAFINLLKFALESQFRRFLREVDEEDPAQKAINFEVLRERMRKERLELKESINFLKQRFPKIKDEPELLRQLEGTADEIEKTMDAVQSLGDKYDRDRTDLVHLAGLGLMVEFLAHELNRATQHALGTIADGKRSPHGMSPEALQTLEQQLKTLQKRLSVMDPATTAGRQRKERFDLVGLAGQVAAGHAEEFKRHGIHCEWRSEPAKLQRAVVNMVKGMVVQVLENLVANSVYWLKQQQRLDSDFKPHKREVFLIVNAACDLQYSPFKRLPNLEQSVYLMPGRLESLQAPIAKSGTDNANLMRMEVFQFHDKNWRIWWDHKRVQSVKLGAFIDWQNRMGYRRITRLSLPHALAVQRYWTSDINRVGLPVNFPLFEPAQMKFYTRNANNAWTSDDQLVGEIILVRHLKEADDPHHFILTKGGIELLRHKLIEARDWLPALISRLGQTGAKLNKIEAAKARQTKTSALLEPEGFIYWVSLLEQPQPLKRHAKWVLPDDEKAPIAFTWERAPRTGSWDPQDPALIVALHPIQSEAN